MASVKETDDVIVIAAHRLMFFLRLALVAALAGYMLPTVSYAMHGDVAASYAAQALKTDEHATHSHGGVMTDHDHGDMAMDHSNRDQTADHHKNTPNQDCCSSFCLNMAVVDNITEFRAVRVSAALDYTNDLMVFAEPIGFNRPPASHT
jgi:hypothetical protein